MVQNEIGMYTKNIRNQMFENYISLQKLINAIQKGDHKKLITKIRGTANKKDRAEMKKKLPAFTLAISKNMKRKSEYFSSSQYIVLDFDDVATGEDLNSKKREIARDIETLAVFISPSGNGLKVVYKLSKAITDGNLFTEIYKNVAAEKSKKYSLQADNVQDCLRLCYYSYDQDLYFNKTCSLIDADKLPPIITSKTKRGRREKQRGKNRNIKEVKRPSRKTTSSEIEKIVTHLKTKRISYSEWISIAFYLCGHPNGEELFLELSVENENFNDTEEECIEKFNDLMNNFSEEKKPSLGRIIFIAKQHGYVYNSFYSFDENDKVYVSDIIYYENFLPSLGIFSYDGTLVHLENRIMTYVEFNDIRKKVRKAVDLLDESPEVKETLVNTIIKKDKSLYSPEKIAYIPESEIRALKDTPDTATLIFKNCCVKVTKDSIEKIDFDNIDTVFLKNQQIPYDYHGWDLDEEFCFNKFLENISSVKENVEWTTNEDNLLVFQTAIGYALHNYKDPAVHKALVLMDEIEDDYGLESNGGTGKSLLTKALSEMTSMKTLQGKSLSSNQTFRFQEVDHTTNLLEVADLQKNFDFEELFNIITNSMQINRKHLPSYTLQYSDSPKFIISSNRIVGNSDVSTLRRKHELIFSHYYGLHKSPATEFGMNFFEDWDNQQWNKFFSCMINCIQKFLIHGLIEVKHDSFKRIMLSKTSTSFLEFAENIEIGVEYDRTSLKELFVQKYPINKNISTQKFSHYLRAFSEATKSVLDISKSNSKVIVRFQENENSRNFNKDLSDEDKYCSTYYREWISKRQSSDNMLVV